MHALRRAVEATIQARRLTLIDLALSWPGAKRIRVPLKRWIACSETTICTPSIKVFMPPWRVGWCAANNRSSSSTGREITPCRVVRGSALQNLYWR
jgi:hypothetical protein